MENETLTIPMMMTLTVELIKWSSRKLMKNPTHDFPVQFYALLMPLVSLVWSYLFGILGWGDAMSIDFSSLFRWALYIMVSIVMYNMGVKPTKEYIRYL